MYVGKRGLAEGGGQRRGEDVLRDKDDDGEKKKR